MFIFFQKVLPKKFLTRLLGLFAHSRCTYFKNLAIRLFIRCFHVNMDESLVTDYRQFKSFNEFFIRRLKPAVRPMPEDPKAMACFSDGKVVEMGKIQAGQLLQAKDQNYTLVDLLAGDPALAQLFVEGQYCTVYLAPKDYHRVHMPFTGQLNKMIYVPGELFSVEPRALQGIPRVFARNERVICLFTTEKGPMAVILVGAMLVGSIVIAWHGQVAPNKNPVIQTETYPDAKIVLRRGDELGYFQWGSTAIVLFAKDALRWQSIKPGDEVKTGQIIGFANEKQVRPKNDTSSLVLKDRN